MGYLEGFAIAYGFIAVSYLFMDLLQQTSRTPEEPIWRRCFYCDELTDDNCNQYCSWYCREEYLVIDPDVKEIDRNSLMYKARVLS